MSVTLTGSGVTFSDSTVMNYDSPKMLGKGSLTGQSSYTISDIPDSASVIFLTLTGIIMVSTPGQLHLSVGPNPETSYYGSTTTNLTSGTGVTTESHVGAVTGVPYIQMTAGTTSVNYQWYMRIQIARTTPQSNSIQVRGWGGTYTQGTATTPRTCWFNGHGYARPMTTLTLFNSTSTGMYGSYTLSYT